MSAREDYTWLLCEDTGEVACNGECPVHRGDACLIVVGWVGKDWTTDPRFAATALDEEQRS